MNKVLIYFFLISFQLLNGAAEAQISKSLLKITEADTLVKVWVFFKDKPQSLDGKNVTKRAQQRRMRNNFIDSGKIDYPVATYYLKSVQNFGAVLVNVYKWENCASFIIHSSKLRSVASLPFVRYIRPVRKYIEINTIYPRFLAKDAKSINSIYGSAHQQLSMLAIPEAHYYLTNHKKLPEPGSEVMVAVFDGGFRLGHECFLYAIKNNKIKAMWDFVDNDSTVHDPDSVINNERSNFYRNDEHGSAVLGLISGHDAGSFMGGAWGVDLVLARTENGINDGEVHYEEDNWFSAIVWAESLGVDIVSSSLAYRTDFKDTILIVRAGDTVAVTEYDYADLDGKTTIVSNAAQYALDRGMIIVNAIGNEGSNVLGTINAPADVKDVISVGAINHNGKVASFSSTGPTSDGRIKPDVVALGVDNVIPSIYENPGTYTTSRGTSFATPLITSVCALIQQAYPDSSADFIRQRLYRFCKTLNFTGVPDNYTGRGIPDALLSCMQDNEICIDLRDSTGRPVQYALIQDKNSDSLAVTSENGLAFFPLKSEDLPTTVYADIAGHHYPISITSSHTRIITTLPFNSGMIVKLTGASEPVISKGSVFYKIPAFDNEFIEVKADSPGLVHLAMYREENVEIFAKADGFWNSDTIRTRMCLDLCTLTLKLEKVSEEKFRIYPNVVKKGKQKRLFIDYTPGEPVFSKIHFCIRALDGTVVWRMSKVAENELRVKIRLDHELDRIAPGCYLFILETEDNIYRKKFLVTN